MYSPPGAHVIPIRGYCHSCSMLQVSESDLELDCFIEFLVVSGSSSGQDWADISQGFDEFAELGLGEPFRFGDVVQFDPVRRLCRLRFQAERPSAVMEGTHERGPRPAEGLREQQSRDAATRQRLSARDLRDILMAERVEPLPPYTLSSGQHHRPRSEPQPAHSVLRRPRLHRYWTRRIGAGRRCPGRSRYRHQTTRRPRTSEVGIIRSSPPLVRSDSAAEPTALARHAW